MGGNLTWDFFFFSNHYLHFSPFFSYYFRLNSKFVLQNLCSVKSKVYFFYYSFNCRNPLLGSTQFHWLSIGHDLCLSKVLVAADYSDSVPDSSSYITNQGYHPLEEVKVCKMVRDTKLTSAEIARTTVEVSVFDTAVLLILKFEYQKSQSVGIWMMTCKFRFVGLIS